MYRMSCVSDETRAICCPDSVFHAFFSFTGWRFYRVFLLSTDVPDVLRKIYLQTVFSKRDKARKNGREIEGLKKSLFPINVVLKQTS